MTVLPFFDYNMTENGQSALNMEGDSMTMVELKNPEYIRVNYTGKLSYGGSQNWFPTDKRLSRDYSIHKWGCGIIAIGDLFLYLARSNRMYATDASALARYDRPVLEWEDYKRYIQYIYQTFAPIMPGSGMNGFALASAVRHYCIKYRIPMTIAWKGFLNDENMLRVMRKMLQENFPVILSIGPNMPLVFRRKGIPFYTMSEQKELILSSNSAVHRHFVVVTGILGRKHKQILLRISSWGTEFYIDYQELRDYIAREGDSLTSSLLYLSGKDGTLF